ncbi:hypothetical protein Btru_005861 [Bulinus truncatus]|nr:hypothetical protein Btru_005861 [Bulinus truncatus]
MIGPSSVDQTIRSSLVHRALRGVNGAEDTRGDNLNPMSLSIIHTRVAIKGDNPENRGRVTKLEQHRLQFFFWYFLFLRVHLFRDPTLSFSLSYWNLVAVFFFTFPTLPREYFTSLDDYYSLAR